MCCVLHVYCACAMFHAAMFHAASQALFCFLVGTTPHAHPLQPLVPPAAARGAHPHKHPALRLGATRLGPPCYHVGRRVYDAEEARQTMRIGAAGQALSLAPVNSSRAELQRAVKKAMVKYHPDKHRSSSLRVRPQILNWPPRSICTDPFRVTFGLTSQVQVEMEEMYKLIGSLRDAM